MDPQTLNAKLFNLGSSDVTKALVTAVLTGASMAVLGVFQTPGFDVFTANWGLIIDMAVNGAVAGFVGYLVKNFFSNSSGQVVTPFGKIG